MRFAVIGLVSLAALAGCNAWTVRSESQPAGGDSPQAAPVPAPTPRATDPQPSPSAPETADADVAAPGIAPEDRFPRLSREPDTSEPAPSPTPEPAKAPAPPRDIWERMRAGFSLSDYDHERVEVHRNWYVRHPDYLRRVAQRAEPFMHLILEEVEKRNMPTELALLPVVESAFQPYAYSHGRAAGIWQFIPGTARHYGLKQNWWYDGRRDVLASTRAALDYLERLHEQFDGDWLLALAAYNSGAGTVRRAMARNRRRGIPTDFWYLDLPRETKGYPPKLLAVSAIVKEPARYGIDLHTIPNEPQVAAVDVGSQIDLALVAELTDLEIETVYRLNPGLNRWATAPDGPHTILVPVDKQAVLKEKLNDYPPKKRIQWKRHRVRRGDTLIEIARRYHTTVGMLRQVNRLRGSRIVAGKHLLVPVAARSLSTYTLSAGQRHKARLARKRDGQKIVHRVRRGETLWELSRQYGVSVRRLAKWNGMAPSDVLRPGKPLVVWVQQAGTAAELSQVRRSGPKGQTVRTLRYVVKRGDSLYRIASRFKVSVADLRRWNGLKRGRYLQPGQRLTLHVDVTRQSEG